ncbi:MAG: ATP-binding cassette domain-containing protein [Coriobacteriia bacterium]|nr:ATP-binding cassette domain-containing protein [Coriobacteriia bacterium]
MEQKQATAGWGAERTAGDGAAYVSVSGLGLKTALGPVYEDVNLTVQKGQVVALFGSEGCGKTSLLLTLGGRMRYQTGTATVAGFDLRKQYKKVRDLSAITIIDRINDVPEYLKVRDLLAAELQMAGKKANRAAVDAYLQEWDFLDRADLQYHQLESNDRLYFGIMLAYVPDPELLLVDDIQSGVTQHRAITWVGMFQQLAAARGTTVIFCTTEYDIALHADAVIIASQKGEDQRQAVLADKGSAALAPITGTCNGVVPQN